MADQVGLYYPLHAAYSRYRIMNSKMINVLLVGRSGAGKTTIIKTLINENAFVESTTGYSETREPSYYTSVLGNAVELGNILYQLNILDTPGLQEHNRDPIQNRNDEALLNLSARCVKENVTSLNVICFVTVAGKTFEQDVEIFKGLKQFLGPDYSSNAMIILTHCEQIPDKTVEQYKKDLSEHPHTKGVYEYCQLGVFSYGAVNLDNLVGLENDKDVLAKVIEVRRRRTAQMRDTLIDAFLGCVDKPVPIAQLEQVRKQYDTELKLIMEEHEAQLKEKMLEENPCSIM